MTEPSDAPVRRRRLVELARWTLTIVATVVSTWALDLVATACGLVLVATGALREGPRALVIGVLAASYAAWAAGLAVNLRANWRLVDETGTSTNALSKLAYEVVRRRTGSRRTQATASAVGYVATEIAKELPYYVGAFGAVVLSDGVDATDALVFLAGANLGAALYEYGLGRATRLLLAGRAARARRSYDVRGYATFERDWVPRDYLHDYYRTVEPDERATIASFVAAFRHAPPDAPVLVFGVGPTLHHVFLAAPAASELHLADYLPANLGELERWLARDDDAHDWRPFVRYTLACEGVAEPSDADVSAREELTRAKVTALLHGDAGLRHPLGEDHRAVYPTVISAYCADSATSDKATWARYLRNIADLVEPGGLFVTAALRRSSGYDVGGRTFPSACVDEEDLRRVLAPCFDLERGSIEVHELVDQPAHGYDGVVLLAARRVGGTPARAAVDGSASLPVA